MDFGDVVVQLGVAGFAIWVLWQTQKGYAKRLDERDEKFNNFVKDSVEKKNEHAHALSELTNKSIGVIQHNTEIIKEFVQVTKESQKIQENLVFNMSSILNTVTGQLKEAFDREDIWRKEKRSLEQK